MLRFDGNIYILIRWSQEPSSLKMYKNECMNAGKAQLYIQAGSTAAHVNMPCCSCCSPLLRRSHCQRGWRRMAAENVAVGQRAGGI